MMAEQKTLVKNSSKPVLRIKTILVNTWPLELLSEETYSIIILVSTQALC